MCTKIKQYDAIFMEYTVAWATLEMGKMQRSYEDSEGYAHYSQLLEKGVISQ